MKSNFWFEYDGDVRFFDLECFFLYDDDDELEDVDGDRFLDFLEFLCGEFDLDDLLLLFFDFEYEESDDSDEDRLYPISVYFKL